MKIRDIQIIDFKSFKGVHSFSFERQPGLYFVKGDNLAEPALGPNGAGKSTLFDALCWCLYGKSLRNLKATSIHNWDAENASTFVRLRCDTADGSLCTIERRWNPNKLTLNDTIVDQEELDSQIGIGEDSFKHSIIHPQFGDMFFDLAATPKLQLFSGILNLDYWMDLSDNANIKRHDTKILIDRLENRIAGDTGRLDVLWDNILGIGAMRDSFDRENKKIIKALKEDIKIIRDTITRTTDKIANVRGKIKKNETILDEVSELKKMNIKPLGRLKEHAAKLTMDLHDADVELESVMCDLERLRGLGAICSTCNQKITKKHLNKEASYINTGIVKWTAVIKELKPDLEDTTNKIEETEEENSEFDEYIEEMRRDNQDRDRRLVGLKRDDKHGHQLLRKQKEKLENRRREKNPHIEAIDEAKQKHQDTKDSIDKNKEKIDNKERRLSAFEYWTKGFKDVRLFLLEECLTHLEIEVNNNLIQLGLHDWAVKFDVERETKSGTISKGFQVMIKSPMNDMLVPWEVWSGGESQRLRLAGSMGLSNLILNRTGVESNIEVWDEPTQHLGGVDDLLDLLYQRAHDQQKQIWLVDHRSIDYGGFEKVIHIIKDENGSRIEE